jgi:hypothetical protein
MQTGTTRCLTEAPETMSWGLRRIGAQNAWWTRAATFGEGLMKRVATRLSAQFGRGFSLASLKRMKQFYLAFPRGSALGGDGGEKGSTALSLFMEPEAREKGAAALSLSPGGPLLFPPTLAWSHYLVLIRVARPEARSFYEIEAAQESWSVRELERQVAALLFDRLAMNKSPEQVLELARAGQQVSVPSDVLKDPFVLEFADLRDNPAAQERDLEQALIDRLEDLGDFRSQRDFPRTSNRRST